MKKRLLISTLGLLLTCGTVLAQIFIQEDEANARLNNSDPAVFVDLPDNHGLGVDYYSPTGSGILLLTALGGAYMLKMKKTKK